MRKRTLTPRSFFADQSHATRAGNVHSIKRLLRPKLTAREAIRQMLKQGVRMSTIARSSKVTLNVIRLHVLSDQPISPKNARKLERWSRGVISSVKMFLLDEVA